MKISIDLDGVLSDFFTDGVNRVAADLWPARNHPSNYLPDSYWWEDKFTKEEVHDILSEIKNIPEFWSTRPGYTENVQALREFLSVESNHEIYYVTSRIQTQGRPIALQTESWLIANHLWPDDNYHAIIPVAEPGLKRFVMADLGIQVSIDDHGTTVEECNQVKGHKAYVLDRPWNRDKDYGTRVFDLQQFLSMAVGKMPAEYFLV